MNDFRSKFGSNRKAPHNLTVQRISLTLVGPSSKLEESEVEKSEMLRRRMVGKRTVEDDAHVPAKEERAECTGLSFACPLPEALQSAGIDPELLLTTKLTRARDRVYMSCRLFRGQLPQEKHEILKWTKKCNQRNSAPVEEMSSFCLFGLLCWTTMMRSYIVSCWILVAVSSRNGTMNMKITKR